MHPSMYRRLQVEQTPVYYDVRAGSDVPYPDVGIKRYVSGEPRAANRPLETTREEADVNDRGPWN